MTAICACWSRRGAHEPGETVRRMSGPLAMYGADRWGEWSGGAVAMGIRQHYVLPEDGADRQPEPRHGTVLVADVRLDNRDTLCRQLSIDPVAAGQWSDSAVVHAAWTRWGSECVHRLVGDFAFVVWDETHQTLTCVRDPLGGRPLCYAHVRGTVVVASMPKGALAVPGVSSELDEVRLGEQLVVLPPNGGRTFFRDVSLIPPGHLLRVTADRMELSRYWHAPAADTVRFARDEEYVERFLELYEEAVLRRLRSIRPVATTLSAGLDSGSVTALAARQLGREGKRLHAVTWVPKPGAEIPDFPNRLTNEGGPASEVAAMYPNVDHHLIQAPDRNPFADLAIVDEAADQPFVTPLVAPMIRTMGGRLSALGCGVLLTGQQGNMTISYNGLRLIPTLLRRGRVVRGGRETLALARAPGWTPRRALFTALVPLVPVEARRLVSRWRRRGRGADYDPFAYCTVNPELARTHDFSGTADRLGWVMSANAPVDGWRMRLAVIESLDIGMGHKGIQADCGVEFRDPTMDVPLVEYCLSIPEDQFLRAGQQRWLIRRAMRGLLPPSVLDATHRGLQAADWPRFLDPYRSSFAAEVHAIESSPLARRVLDVAKLHRLLETWPAQWTGGHMQSHALTFLRGLGIGHFIRQHETRAAAQSAA